MSGLLRYGHTRWMVSGAGVGPESLPLPSHLCICSLLKGGYVLRGSIHSTGPRLEHLRFGHRSLGHHHDLYCDRWLHGGGGVGGKKLEGGDTEPACNIRGEPLVQLGNRNMRQRYRSV